MARRTRKAYQAAVKGAVYDSALPANLLSTLGAQRMSSSSVLKLSWNWQAALQRKDLEVLLDANSVYLARSNKEISILGISICRNCAYKAILKQQQEEDAAHLTGEPIINLKTALLKDILSTLN